MDLTLNHLLLETSTGPFKIKVIVFVWCGMYSHRCKCCQNDIIDIDMAPCSCLNGHVKDLFEMSMAWEPNRRSNFFFGLPAHLCAFTYVAEKSSTVMINNRYNITLSWYWQNQHYTVHDVFHQGCKLNMIDRHCANRSILHSLLVTYLVQAYAKVYLQTCKYKLEMII